VAAKSDENGGQTVGKENSRIQFDGGRWVKKFNNSIL
jgi:hypothetical protein